MADTEVDSTIIFEDTTFDSKNNYWNQPIRDGVIPELTLDDVVDTCCPKCHGRMRSVQYRSLMCNECCYSNHYCRRDNKIYNTWHCHICHGQKEI
jgi:hypothetical protein